MADTTSLTREGLALIMGQRIAEAEKLWSSTMGTTVKVERAAALDLLAEVLRTIDGKRPYARRMDESNADSDA